MTKTENRAPAEGDELTTGRQYLLTPEYGAAMVEMAKHYDMSVDNVLRAAIRLYQAQCFGSIKIEHVRDSKLFDPDVPPKGTAEPIGYLSEHTGPEGPFKWQFSKTLAGVYRDTALRIIPVYEPAHATNCWTIISPRGAIFTGETPFRAANEANKHVRATGPVKAKEFADMLERLQAENEAENSQLLADHGTLNCPACGGSGHIGDVEASARQEAHGWVTMWPAMGGGEKPVYSHGASRPSYGVELNELLTVYPVYDRSQAPAVGAPPSGFALVSLADLADWRMRVNTLACLSVKAERHRAGADLKGRIADHIEAASKPPVQGSEP